MNTLLWTYIFSYAYQDSALNHLVRGPVYENESREPSPTKSITPVPEEGERRSESRSRPASPDTHSYNKR